MSNDNFRNRLKYDNNDKQIMHEKLMSLLNEYEKNNSYENREFLCYLTSAIFLTYKKLYPQLSIYIPFRTKSDMSFIKNIQKEFSDTSKEDLLDTFSISKDISGIRIILDNINYAIPPKGESASLFNDSEVRELLELSHNNFHFVEQVNHYIQSPIKNGKQYIELKKQLLEKIISITPSEFTEERKPRASFSKLLEDAKEQYNYFLENDSFPTLVSENEITELSTLLTEFRSRIDDPLHFAILRKTLPVVFEHPLIKNVLKTSSKFSKESKKANGFQSIYYTLNTPFGFIEVQSQSNKAYYTSTKGSAYHSGMNGKKINIKDFFELVDPNDENDISYYLDTLDSISADSMISPYEIPDLSTEEEIEDFLDTPLGNAYLESEKYRDMMKHIKIKEKMEILPQYLPDDVFKALKLKKYKPLQELLNSGEITSCKLHELIDNGDIKPIIMNTDEYLISTALSLSPYMNVCSSGHTSYTNAGIHHKKVIGEFAEVLRKRDSNTCLRDLIIRRLENIIENNDPNLEQYLKIVKKHDEIALKLPKDISHKNILLYAEKLRDMEQSNADRDL